MAIFEYKAKTSRGQTVSGGVEAPSEEKAIQTLEDRGLILLSITQREKEGVFQITIFSRIKPKDVVVFFRQLSVLVSATIPIVQSLRVLLKQTTDHQLQRIVSEIADDVEGGARLSQACERHPPTRVARDVGWLDRSSLVNAGVAHNARWPFMRVGARRKIGARSLSMAR